MTNRRAWSVMSLLAAAAVTVSCVQVTAAISEQDLESWLAAYGAAWEAKDPAQVAALFTENALYQETPYAEPYRGRDGIASYWASVTADQADIEFRSEVIAIEGITGVAIWSANFRSIAGDVSVGLNGVFILEFSDTSHVKLLREWWHAR